jgi:capsular polysaccharide biosynthesis protein
MDLLSIVQAIWRRKLFAIPIILLTLIGALYELKIKPPVYQASASILLVTPPNAPTAAQIAADPALGRVNTNNPYMDYGELSVAADSVIDLVTAEVEQPALAKAGVDLQYQMELSSDFGNPPIIEITANGSTPTQAIHGAEVLAEVATADLLALQEQQNVNPHYMITATDLVQPTQAQMSKSGKTRSTLAVLAVGLIALFVVVSVADAVDKRRKKRRASDDSGSDLQETARADQEADLRRRGLAPSFTSSTGGRGRTHSLRR